MHEVLRVRLHSNEVGGNSHDQAVVDSVVGVFWSVDCREQRRRRGNTLTLKGGAIIQFTCDNHMIHI